MKKTYANYRTDMRIGDVVIDANKCKWTVNNNILKMDWESPIEVISQAPRQVLTWEYCKERVDELGELRIWDNDSEYCLIAANKKEYLTDEYYWRGWQNVSHFTEPPIPELIDLVEEEPEVKRLWWYKTQNGTLRHTRECYGKTEFLARFKPQEYCEGEEVPKEGWVKP